MRSLSRLPAAAQHQLRQILLVLTHLALQLQLCLHCACTTTAVVPAAAPHQLRQILLVLTTWHHCRHYTSSFATGLSGHGLLTNGIALIQDVGGPSPRFGVGGFMLLVACVQVASLVAFDWIRRNRSSIAASEAQRAAGKTGGRGWRGKTGDELLDGEKEGLTDCEEGREELDGSGASSGGAADGGGDGSARSFAFLPLLASQAWTNYTYFLIPSLLPYVSRLPELRGLGTDPRTGEPNGSDGMDSDLYMWLNFVTT